VRACVMLVSFRLDLSLALLSWRMPQRHRSAIGSVQRARPVVGYTEIIENKGNDNNPLSGVIGSHSSQKQFPAPADRRRCVE
jgi:hypothetical protein